MQDPNSDVVRKWLEEDYNWFERRAASIGAIWHNKIPRSFRFWGIVSALVKGATLCSAPAAAFFYQVVSASQAVVVAAGIVLLNVLAAIANRFSAARAVPNDYQTEAGVRFGDLLSTMKKGGSIPAAQRDVAISSCLGIIENFSLPVTRAKKGQISVSLLLYVGSSTQKMRIAKRNPGNERPANREISTKGLLGHVACQAGADPRVVNNIGAFGPTFAKSPTQTRMSYKSILILPLECKIEGETRIRGFVSIDCTRPYAFHGNSANVIVVMSEQIIDQLRELISGR